MRINKLLEGINFNSPYDSLFKKWKYDCSRTISKIEGEKTSTFKAFEEIDFEGNSLGIGCDDDQIFNNHFRQCLREAQAILLSIQEAIQQEISLEAATTSQKTEIQRTPSTRKVFIVHGHDEQLKTQVEQFLERLDLQPIILHKQANQGQTIIEKFERHSDVAFAVVLLTPDDVGGKMRAQSDFEKWMNADELEAEALRARARQNVIFEFGFFLGKLGRSKVCGLYCEGVELPSDYDGVLYTKVDESNSWQQELLKELRAAGFPVDANRLT